MSADHFEPDRDGVDGGVGKLVTIHGATYQLAELIHQGERETQYAVVNIVTGLRRFVIKLYPAGFPEQQIQDDAARRLVSCLELEARGIPVLRADVVLSSCGPLRLMRASMGDADVAVECKELLERAQGEHDRHEFAAAVATCDAIAAINPRHTDAMAVRAQCLLATSGPEDALQLMLEVCKLEPNHELFSRLAAEYAVASGRSHVAIRLLYAQVERAPGDIVAAERLVELLLHELQIELADQIVKSYRHRLSPDAAAHYFRRYDAGVGHAKDRAAAITHILRMQQEEAWTPARDAWTAARDAWQPFVGAASRIAFLNLETCRYHLADPLDLGGLFQLSQQSNPMIRSVAWTLMLLGAARQNDMAFAALAAQATKDFFPDPMDLCGVPIWTLSDRQLSGRPEPIVAALHALAAASTKDDERQLFRWVAGHYQQYAGRIGSQARVLSTTR